jgi:hypothetical protein
MELTREERYAAVENLFRWRSTLVQKEWFLGGRHDREYRYTTKVPLHYNNDSCLEFEASDVGLRVLLVIKQNGKQCNQFCLHSNYCSGECCDCNPCINHSTTIYDYFEYLDELDEQL